jgi:hypothetical protein
VWRPLGTERQRAARGAHTERNHLIICRDRFHNLRHSSFVSSREEWGEWVPCTHSLCLSLRRVEAQDSTGLSGEAADLPSVS